MRFARTLAMKPTTKKGHKAAMPEGGKNLQHSLHLTISRWEWRWKQASGSSKHSCHARRRGGARTEQLLAPRRLLTEATVSSRLSYLRLKAAAAEATCLNYIKQTKKRNFLKKFVTDEEAGHCVEDEAGCFLKFMKHATSHTYRKWHFWWWESEGKGEQKNTSLWKPIKKPANKKNALLQIATLNFEDTSSKQGAKLIYWFIYFASHD